MTIEASIFAALNSLVSGRVYRGIAPANVTLLPRITFQQVGGESINFMDQADPDLSLPRIQFNSWAASYDESKALARQVQSALRGSSLQVTALGEPVVTPETNVVPWLYGAMQDFIIADAS
jgi:Protein of unknown function (DUF3168)